MTITIGIDIGSGAVKSTLFRVHVDGRQEWLAKRCERIRRRDPMTLAQEGHDGVLADAGLSPGEVDYVATTGEGENVKFATGHFYSMTTHARGGVFLDPEARAVVDIGALNGRAISIDAPRGSSGAPGSFAAGERRSAAPSRPAVSATMTTAAESLPLRDAPASRTASRPRKSPRPPIVP